MSSEGLARAAPVAQRAEVMLRERMLEYARRARIEQGVGGFHGPPSCALRAWAGVCFA